MRVTRFRTRRSPTSFEPTIQIERGGIASRSASRSTRRIDSGWIVGCIDMATVSGPSR